MTRSQHTQIYLVLCTILLGPPAIKGISLHKVEQRDLEDVQETTEHLDGDNTKSFQTNAQEYQLTTQSTVTKASQSSPLELEGTTANKEFALNEQQETHSLYDNSTGNGGNTEINNSSIVVSLNPSGQEETSDENGNLTTAISSVDYLTTTIAENMTTEVVKSYNAEEDNTKMNKTDNLSQVSTIEILRTSPRTNSIIAEDMSTLPDEPAEISPISIGLNNQSSFDSITVIAPSVESSLPLYINSETVTHINLNITADSTVPLQNDDWDDTKSLSFDPLNVTLQKDSTQDHNNITPPALMENMTGLFRVGPGESEPGTNENISVQQEDDKTGLTNHFNHADNTTMMTSLQNQDDVEQVNETTNNLNNPAILLDATTPGIIPEVEITVLPEPTLGRIAPLQEDPGVVTSTSVTLTSTAKNHTFEDLNPTSGQQASLLSVSPPLLATLSAQAEKATTFISLPDKSFPSSTVSAKSNPSTILLPTTLPSRHFPPSTAPLSTFPSTFASTQVNPGQVHSPGRVSSTVNYGLDKVESEEGGELEDDEDDDDEVGDEEEEEEEEEKDNDSADESAEADADLPPFTLPGLSSQEPVDDDIGGAAYQVPDTLEWEQQKQGLMRSWMEKLKDKAGYMSGMLVPVGVGVAGALLILAALYSMKIMNRRKRNGFKRHKRKQREFNSMQDRVMLLADSSEDEF